MRTLASLLLALLLPQTALGAESPRTLTALTYVTYVAGLTVMTMAADVELRGDSYRVDLASRTAGAYGVMFRGETRSSALGSFVSGGQAGGLVAPLRYAVAGHWRGTARHTLMDYANGVPSVLRMQPPNESEREQIAPALQRETVDTISAAALLMRRVTDSGRCEGEARTFDGRRLSQVGVRSAGWETLPRDDRSSFAGPALRCDFEGELLAGFMLDSDRAAAARPQKGSAWLARPIEGAPILPVRLRFEARWIGSATMYLTSASSNAAPLVRTRADAENGAAPIRLP